MSIIWSGLSREPTAEIRSGLSPTQATGTEGLGGGFQNREMGSVSTSRGVGQSVTMDVTGTFVLNESAESLNQGLLERVD